MRNIVRKSTNIGQRKLFAWMLNFRDQLLRYLSGCLSPIDAIAHEQEVVAFPSKALTAFYQLGDVLALALCQAIGSNERMGNAIGLSNDWKIGHLVQPLEVVSEATSLSVPRGNSSIDVVIAGSIGTR